MEETTVWSTPYDPPSMIQSAYQCATLLCPFTQSHHFSVPQFPPQTGVNRSTPPTTSGLSGKWNQIIYVNCSAMKICIKVTDVVFVILI